MHQKSGASAELQGFLQKKYYPNGNSFPKAQYQGWRFFLKNPEGLTLQERWRLIFV